KRPRERSNFGHTKIPVSAFVARGSLEGTFRSDKSARPATECLMKPHTARHRHVPRHAGAALDVRRDEFASVSSALKHVNNVTRDEFIAATNDIRESMRNFQIQFTRIAQLQAELDEVKHALADLTAAQGNSVPVRR